MRLFLYTAPLRARYRAASIRQPVEVPDAAAEEYLRAGIARRAGGDAQAAASEVAQPEEPAAVETEAPPAWPHKMAPAAYIHRFPDGPDADLARRVLGES